MRPLILSFRPIRVARATNAKPRDQRGLVGLAERVGFSTFLSKALIRNHQRPKNANSNVPKWDTLVVQLRSQL